MQMRNPSFFSGIWETITRFFRSLFSCCSTPEATTEKIQEIASRDHFVWFYKKEENLLTAFLGNFYPSKIHLWDFEFQCAEAAFQAAKFTDPSVIRRFQRLDGQAAFRLGRQLTQNWERRDRDNWRARNLAVMDAVLHAKFSQNPRLKELLLATGDAYLVEHIPVKGRDAFWGDDSDGTGQNWLGTKLMEVRRRLGGSGHVAGHPNYDAFLRR